MSSLINTIIISGLHLEVVIGTYPEERLRKQKISLDLQIELARFFSADIDKIEGTINYAAVVERIQYWSQQKQFFLIESLANYLVNQLLQEFPIEKIKLQLNKFPRDIPVDHVGVIVETTRSLM